MFCPNCDRIYIKEKVCPYCGIKLRRATGKPDKKKEQKKWLHTKTTAEMRCPQCDSRKIFAHEKERNRRFVRGKSLVLALLMLVLYFFELLFVKRTEHICLDCGHIWN